jgi:hypothetical protein
LRLVGGEGDEGRAVCDGCSEMSERTAVSTVNHGQAEPPSEQQDEVRACVRFGAPDLDPDAVTVALGLAPTEAHRRGEPRRTRRATITGKPPTYRVGIWWLDSPLPTSATVQEHVEWLLDRLEPRAEEVRKIAATGIKPDFFVSVLPLSTQFGFELSPEVMRRIAALNIWFGVIT